MTDNPQFKVEDRVRVTADITFNFGYTGANGEVLPEYLDKVFHAKGQVGVITYIWGFGDGISVLFPNGYQLSFLPSQLERV